MVVVVPASMPHQHPVHAAVSTASDMAWHVTHLPPTSTLPAPSSVRPTPVLLLVPPSCLMRTTPVRRCRGMMRDAGDDDGALPAAAAAAGEPGVLQQPGAAAAALSSTTNSSSARLRRGMLRQGCSLQPSVLALIAPVCCFCCLCCCCSCCYTSGLLNWCQQQQAMDAF